MVTGPTTAGAQVVPFPQEQQSWTYRITGVADFDAPLDAVLSYSATVQLTVTTINSSLIDVTETVMGGVVWPSGVGSGEILLVRRAHLFGGVIHSSASNTSFYFETKGGIDLQDSKVFGVDDEEFSRVILIWSSASNTVFFFIGLTWVWFTDSITMVSVNRPSFLLAPHCYTMVYWDTDYAPWGNVDPYCENPFVGGFDGAPIHNASDEWVLDVISTPFGMRQALKNVTTIAISGFPSAAIVVSSWIDIETGLLLLLTEEVSATGLQSSNIGLSGISTNSTQSTSIELVAGNFFGILGYLLWTKISGVSLFSLLIISGVFVVACLIMGKVSYSVMSKSKRKNNR
jgi:hypothetical protein